jgi:ABC-type bacteriocin/lantibiotic exporter with double-glycine peptidase domain
MTRVPVRLQMSSVECGAACLAMVLSHHGRNTRTAECRDACEAGRDGTSARALVEAARGHGLAVRVLRAPAGALARCPLPLVAHWSGNHFVVVERAGPDGVRLVDPASGRQRLTPEEFARHYSGTVLTFQRTPTFEPRKRSPHRAWATLARHVARTPGLRPALGQILAASVLVAAASLVFPLGMQVLVDELLVVQATTDLTRAVAAGGALLALTVFVVTFLRQALLVFVHARLDEELMTGFFRHLLTLPLRYFQRRTSGDLLMRLSSNAQLRELLASHSVGAVIDGGLATLYVVFLLSQSRTIGLAVLAVAVAHVAFLLATTRAMHGLMRRDLALQATAQGYLVDVLSSIAGVKASGGEARVWEHWGEVFRRQLAATMVRGRLGATVGAAGSAVRASVPVMVLGLGAALVVRGELTLGQLLATATVTAAFLGPLTALVTRGQQFQLAGAYAERLADVLQEPPEQAQPPALGRRLHGGVELCDVTFSYGGGGRPALEGVSLTVAPGTRVAVVGPTGSGKSTLALVLLTLHEPQAGEVRFDGAAAHEMNLQLLRRNFGAVLQDTTLLDGTIREIVGWHDPAMPEHDVVRALEVACLAGDVAALPMGLDTRVGERGHALSGGQRQRLAIARAVAHRPRLLVLDEATSHLDSGTEGRLARNLRALACTQVVVAHRLATVADADEILVMDAGHVRARGTHQHLLRHDDGFRALMDGQVTGSAGWDVGSGNGRTIQSDDERGGVPRHTRTSQAR